MLMVYGPLMPVRVLEEVRFWKTQEREHTVVIRALVPDLEPPYVKLLGEWEGAFEQLEMAAGQMLEAVIRGGLVITPVQHAQVSSLHAAAAAQSQQFVQQLMRMERESAPIRMRPVVKTGLEHIIRESEYFLGVLQAGQPLPAAPRGTEAEWSQSAASDPANNGWRAGRNGSSADLGASPPAGAVPPGDMQDRVYLHVQPAGDKDRVPTQEPAEADGSGRTYAAAQAAPVPIGGHKLPPLPYPYDALEPHIDEATMRLHHDKHHQSYVDGLNRAEKKLAEARESGDFALVKHWERELAFHGAGHYLHTLFWSTLSPRGGGKPGGALLAAIEGSFGSFEKFMKHFSEAASQVEGGGWALLVWSPRSRRLEVVQAEKHQNLSQQDTVPLLPLDVWEHAYYLKYRNERPKYVAAWWNIVNWPLVEERFAKARQLRWEAY